MICPYEILTTCVPYTYIHVTYLIILSKNLQVYSIPHSCMIEKGTQEYNMFPPFRNRVTQ